MIISYKFRLYIYIAIFRLIQVDNKRKYSWLSPIDNVVFRLGLYSFYSQVFSKQRGCFTYKQRPAVCRQLDPLLLLILLQMEALGFSEMLVSTCQNTLCHAPNIVGFINSRCVFSILYWFGNTQAMDLFSQHRHFWSCKRTTSLAAIYGDVWLPF